jgi:DNA replication protein DnaC
MLLFKREEIKSHVIDWLNETIAQTEGENGYDYDFRDTHEVHNDIFNIDYYIIGTYQAKQWLGDMAFDVINIIKEYEQDNFGEVNTDFSQPEHVVNMYAYIVGEEIISEAMEETGVLDVEVTA